MQLICQGSLSLMLSSSKGGSEREEEAARSGPCSGGKRVKDTCCWAAAMNLMLGSLFEEKLDFGFIGFEVRGNHRKCNTKIHNPPFITLRQFSLMVLCLFKPKTELTVSVLQIPEPKPNQG